MSAGQGLLAAVLAPVKVRPGAQDAGALLAAGIVLGHEGADVQAHTVVDVRLPADGLLFERLPADENVEGGLALDDGGEALLQLLGSEEAVVRAAFAAFERRPAGG